jgi:hypothetical protein
VTRSVRVALAVAGVANLVFAAGYALHQPWATGLWPWETGPLSYAFLGSMLAAVGAAACWIAWSGETGSLPAGFLNLTVTLGGIGGYLLLSGQQGALAAAVGALALVNLGLFAWTHRLPRDKTLPISGLLRGSYLAFAVVLVVVGVALMLRRPVLPWPVDADTSVAFGWIFFGDAWYFAYALAHPWWASARAQLWSFLGYDLVLFVPLAAHLDNVDPTLRDNLLLYLAILLYSAVLAVAYLLVNRRTRGW